MNTGGKWMGDWGWGAGYRGQGCCGFVGAAHVIRRACEARHAAMYGFCMHLRQRPRTYVPAAQEHHAEASDAILALLNRQGRQRPQHRKHWSAAWHVQHTFPAARGSWGFYRMDSTVWTSGRYNTDNSSSARPAVHCTVTCAFTCFLGSLGG